MYIFIFALLAIWSLRFAGAENDLQWQKKICRSRNSFASIKKCFIMQIIFEKILFLLLQIFFCSCKSFSAPANRFLVLQTVFFSCKSCSAPANRFLLLLILFCSCKSFAVSKSGQKGVLSARCLLSSQSECWSPTAADMDTQRLTTRFEIFLTLTTFVRLSKVTHSQTCSLIS